MAAGAESERLLKVMEAEQLNARQFSEELGIQPGTVSNILKGRNKPSLEVMQKLLKRFVLISPDWLISGKGPMYRPKNDSQEPTLFDLRPETPSESTGTVAGYPSETPSETPALHRVQSKMEHAQSKTEQAQSKTEHAQFKTERVHSEGSASYASQMPLSRRATRVMVFYDDGTYDELPAR